MGYSFGCRARSAKLRQKMHSFMLQNYRSWPEVKGEGKDAYSRYPEDPDDLSYDHNPRVLGLDYNASCWEREYVFTIVKWMAIRVGQRSSRFSKDAVRPNMLDHSVPFTVYDGYERWPLLVGTPAAARNLPKSIRWCAVDEFGMKNGPGFVEHYLVAAVCDVMTPEHQKAYKEAIAKLPPCPDSHDQKAYRAHLETLRRLLAKHKRPQIDAGVKLIRDEMIRLDGLWRALP